MTFDLVGEVRRSIAEETGEPVSRATASVFVDRMCDAFVQKWEGVGPAYAVSQAPDVARYLAHRWHGEDGKRLRAALADHDAGTSAAALAAEMGLDEPEPEWTCDWLIEGVPPARRDDDDWYPDFPSDLIYKCGAKVTPHPDYPDSGWRCEAGHEHLPLEVEYAPYGPAWQREQREERYAW